MTIQELSIVLSEQMGLETKMDVSLAPYTTWKIGGLADILTLTKSKDELIKLIQYCQSHSIEFTILGKGSNVLISDNGIRGLVIINEYTEIKVGKKISSISNSTKDKLVPRVDVEQYSELDYAETELDQVEVTIASGTILSYAINYLIDNGTTGLHWFAGIPGTIGGALYNNIHGGTHFFSEFILSAMVIDNKGQLIELEKAEMHLDYDQSIFHSKDYVIIEVKFLLNKGDSKRALNTSIAWARKKAETQPYNSGGCCFKNINNSEKDILNIPSNSWGYIIDNILHLKGTRVGNAIISYKHGAFIENLGNASSNDVLALMSLIYSKAKDEIRITPKSEIVFLGFKHNEIEKFI